MDSKNNDKKKGKVNENIENFSQYDKRVLASVKKDPNKTNFRIAKELKRLGHSTSDWTIYTRLK